MTTERRPASFSQFGGLRLDLPLDEIGGEQAADIFDVDWITGVSGLRSRPGATKVNSSEATSNLRRLFGATNGDLIVAEEVSASKSKLLAYSLSGSPIESPEFSGAAKGASFAAFGVPGSPYVYIAFIGQAPHRFNGTEFTSPTATVDGVGSKAMPKANFLAAWPDDGTGKDRLLFANTSSTGGPGGAASSSSHVWFSEPEGKAESFESTAYDQLSPGDGEEIAGMIYWNNQIFVFKQTRCFVYYGITEDEEGRPIFSRRDFGFPGLMGGSLIDANDEGVYFLTSAGLFLTTGSRPAPVSGALAPLDNRFGASTEIEGPASGSLGLFRWTSFYQLVCLDRRIFLLSQPDSTVQIMLVFDLERGAWTVWSSRANFLGTWNAFSRSRSLYFTSGKNIYHFDPEAEEDPTVTMEPRWQSGFYDLGNQDEKELVGVRAFGAGTVDAESFSDLGESASPSKGHFAFPAEGAGTVLDDNALTDHGVMFSHKLTLEPGSRVQRLVRYLRETRTPATETGR